MTENFIKSLLIFVCHLQTLFFHLSLHIYLSLTRFVSCASAQHKIFYLHIHRVRQGHNEVLNKIDLNTSLAFNARRAKSYTTTSTHTHKGTYILGDIYTHQRKVCGIKEIPTQRRRSASWTQTCARNLPCHRQCLQYHDKCCFCRSDNDGATFQHLLSKPAADSSQAASHAK